MLRVLVELMKIFHQLLLFICSVSINMSSSSISDVESVHLQAPNMLDDDVS
jgi:hypothetical protein